LTEFVSYNISMHYNNFKLVTFDDAFFYGGRGLNTRPYLVYVLSIPTELSSRIHIDDATL